MDYDLSNETCLGEPSRESGPAVSRYSKSSLAQEEMTGKSGLRWGLWRHRRKEWAMPMGGRTTWRKRSELEKLGMHS